MEPKIRISLVLQVQFLPTTHSACTVMTNQNMAIARIVFVALLMLWYISYYGVHCIPVYVVRESEKKGMERKIKSHSKM
jgi:hypothetical protein